MSDQHEINALEARIAELESRLDTQKHGGRLRKPPLSRRLAILGIALALLLPGIALASHRFSDVPDSNAFHNDIDWLADYGITTGFPDGTYRPGQPVARQAMAAFMHRLSNQFEVVSSDYDPGPLVAYSRSTPCPGDKRPIAGGGFASSGNLFITGSYPLGSAWYVTWESDNDVLIDPANLTVFAVCAPRL
ncbi:MAG: S-layer homology domain-containing protein [Candidatus Limnocylindrales bacterium]